MCDKIISTLLQKLDCSLTEQGKKRNALTFSSLTFWRINKKGVKTQCCYGHSFFFTRLHHYYEDMILGHCLMMAINKFAIVFICFYIFRYIKNKIKSKML